MNKRINIKQVETSEIYYQLPKILFTDDHYKKLSLEAKTLYTFMKDMMKISRKNGWIDKNGDVFIHFTNNRAAELLGIGETKAKDIRKELIGFQLIEVVNPEGSTKRASNIYVHNLSPTNEQSFDAIGRETTYGKTPLETNGRKTTYGKSLIESNGRQTTYGTVGKRPMQRSEYDPWNGRQTTASKNNPSKNNSSKNKEPYEEDDDVNKSLKENTIADIKKRITSQTELKTLTPRQEKMISDWFDIYDIGVILNGIDKAAEYGGRSLQYIQEVIKSDQKILDAKLKEFETTT